MGFPARNQVDHKYNLSRWAHALPHCPLNICIYRVAAYLETVEDESSKSVTAGIRFIANQYHSIVKRTADKEIKKSTGQRFELWTPKGLDF